MQRCKHISASVLATVLVVSALMLLLVFGVLALWEADFVFFSRAGYVSQQRANLESAFLWYKVDSTLINQLDDCNNIQLYDSLSDSRVHISIYPWGLYEAVRVHASDPRISSVRLFGATHPVPPLRNQCCNLWYSTKGTTLSLTGRIVLHGFLRLPRHGVQYGQIRSVFFCGEPVETGRTAYVGTQMPALRYDVNRQIDHLFNLLSESGAWEAMPDSLAVGFCEYQPRLLNAEGVCENISVEGSAILLGNEITIDSTCNLKDVLVVGHTIRIEDGFQGRVQLFAEDTVIIGQEVNLQYPSGVFVRRQNPNRYLEIGANSRVEGYAIVAGEGNPDVKRRNYCQARTSVLRGLLWVDGAAQVQGIVSGCIVANSLVYYSTEGYYEDMAYDLTLLENPATAYPLWAFTPYERKEAGWLLNAQDSNI